MHTPSEKWDDVASGGAEGSKLDLEINWTNQQPVVI